MGKKHLGGRRTLEFLLVVKKPMADMEEGEEDWPETVGTHSSRAG